MDEPAVFFGAIVADTIAVACDLIPVDCDDRRTVVGALERAREWLLADSRRRLPSPERWVWFVRVLGFAIGLASPWRTEGDRRARECVLAALGAAAREARWCATRAERDALERTHKDLCQRVAEVVASAAAPTANEDARVCTALAALYMDHARARWSRDERRHGAPRFETDAIGALRVARAGGNDDAVAWFRGTCEAETDAYIGAQCLEWWMLGVTRGALAERPVAACDWTSLFHTTLLPMVEWFMTEPSRALSFGDTGVLLERRARLCVPLGELAALVSALGSTDTDAAAGSIVARVVVVVHNAASDAGCGGLHEWVARAIEARAYLLSHPNSDVSECARALVNDAHAMRRVRAGARALACGPGAFTAFLVALFGTRASMPLPPMNHARRAALGAPPLAPDAPLVALLQARFASIAR